MSENYEKVEIRKVEIHRNTGLKVVYVDNPTLDNGEVSNDDITKKSTAHFDNSIKVGFRELVAHALLIQEYPCSIDETYIKARKIIDDPAYKQFKVVGFEIKANSFEDDENAKVAIVCTHELEDGEIYKYTLPFVRLYSGSSYEFSGNLHTVIEKLISEVKLYLGGKVMPSNQTKLDFDSQQEEEEEYEEEDEI